MPWSENDFLERLMPQLRQQRGATNGACPDAATILAVMEGEADEWLRHAYAQHLSQCSSCFELDERLRHFDRPLLADDREWKQTEKRLDIWADTFLRSKSVAPVALNTSSSTEPARFWRSLWRPGLASKLSLVTVLVVLAAVGVDLYLRLQPPPLDSNERRQQSIPAAEPPKGPESEKPPSISPLPGGGGLPKQGPMAEATAPTPPASAPPPEPQTVTVAKNEPPPAPQQPSAKPRAPVPPPPPSGPSTGQTTVATATAKPRPTPAAQTPAAEARATDAGNTRPAVIASAAPNRSIAATPKRPGAATHAFSTGPAMEAVAVSPQSSQPSQARAQRSAPILPASLHLAAGARLWLALDSFSFQADGRVMFYGSLLLPLDSTGSSALDHGTEVSGFVTSAQGQSSVLLSEIVIRGTHYKLKSQAGAGNARTAGSGGAVQFDSGKVLEMWVSSDSTYERSPADSMQ